MTERTIIGLLIIFVMNGFWGLVDPWRDIMYIYISLCTFCLIYSVPKRNIISSKESKILFAFLLSIIPNLIASYYNRHQSPILVMRNVEFLDYLYFLSFFVFAFLELSVIEITNIIKFCYITFIICFFLQYFVFFPTPVFKYTATTIDEHRFRMVGQIVGFIGYYYYLNQALVFRDRRYGNLFLSVIGLTFIILLGFRTHIFVTLIVSIYMIFKTQKVTLQSLKYIFLIAIGFVFIFSTEFGNNVINNINRRQETDVMSNDGYVRVAQWEYFTHNHFVSVTDYIFGSGIPSGKTTYSKNMEVRTKSNPKAKILTLSPTQWRDWGLLGLSWMMGIPIFLVLLYFIGYMILKKVPPQFLYISATYIALLLSGFSTIEFYREGAYVFHGLMLCLIFQLDRQLRMKKFLYTYEVGIKKKASVNSL